MSLPPSMLCVSLKYFSIKLLPHSSHLYSSISNQRKPTPPFQLKQHKNHPHAHDKLQLNWSASALNGFVKKSACCHVDRTCIVWRSLPSQPATKGSDCVSMCFEFELVTGFSPSSTAPSLSSNTGTHGVLTSGSIKHQTLSRNSTSSKASAIATYFAYVVKSVTRF